MLYKSQLVKILFAFIIGFAAQTLFALESCSVWSQIANDKSLKDNDAFWAEVSALNEKGQLTDLKLEDLMDKFHKHEKDGYFKPKSDWEMRHEAVVEKARAEKTKQEESSSGEKKTQESRSPQREALVKEYVSRNFTSPDQNEEWMKMAASSDRGALKDAKFFDVENASMKTLNDTTKDKDLVTSLTNRNKEYMFNAVRRVVERNPGMKMSPYSDFKSTRFAFTGKIPVDLEQQLKREFAITNSEFAHFINSQKLSGLAKSHPENWFRAGFGNTADQATAAARYARRLEDSNGMQSFTSPELRRQLSAAVQETEAQRVQIQTEFHGTGLLEEISGTGKQTLTQAAFDLVRKAKNSQELATTLSKTYGLHLTPTQAKSLIKYSKSVDEFNPGIHIGKREFASLTDANRGGVSADFAGLGAGNLNATAKGLASSKNLDEVLAAARKEEQALTAEFQLKKDKYEGVVNNYLIEKKQMSGAQVTCSGDDCVIVASRNISLKEKAELVQRLSRDDHPAGVRMAFVNENIENPKIRNEMASHGESIEKKLRENLRGILPQEKLDQVMFSVDMRGGELGHGGVRLITGNARVELTASDRELIQTQFQKSVDDLNRSLKKDQKPHEYSPEP